MEGASATSKTTSLRTSHAVSHEPLQLEGTPQPTRQPRSRAQGILAI
jgi:hypothetical protein